MKALLKRLCWILAISAVLVGCSEEGMPLIDVPEELVGQWRQISEVNANCPNAGNNGTFEKDCTTEECLEYTFDANGTVTRRFIEDGNRSVETNSFTLDREEIFIEKGQTLEVLSYELFRDQLNLIYIDDRTRCTVIQVFAMN